LKLIQIISVGYNGGEGIIQKYLNFQEAFLENGVEHHLIILMPYSIQYSFPKRNNIYIIQSHVTREKYLLHRMWIKEVKKIQQTIKSIPYDYIILRVDSINKCLYRFISENKNKIILDYPTAPIEEYLIHKPTYQKLALKYNQEAINNSLFNIVTIPEVSYKKSYLFPNSLLEKKYISKSIYLKPSQKKDINFLLMSSKYGKYEVNGFDRLLNSLKDYTKSNSSSHKFNIYLAGTIEKNTQTYFESFNSPCINIIFLGFQTIESLNRIINDIDLGVNTIGYHRNKVFVNSTLKTVDFIGWHLPSIISHQDSNLKGNESYIFKITPNEDLIDINKLLEFLENLNDDFKQQIHDKYLSISLNSRIKEFLKYLGQQ